MKEFRNPVFDLGVIGLILFLASVVVINNNRHAGYVVLLIAVALGVIFWIINLVEVARSRRLTDRQKRLWLMVVFLLPMLGGFVYYIFSGSNEKRTIE